MARTPKRKFPITPEEALARLPDVPFDPASAEKVEQLGRADLLHSILAIAGLDHNSESALVRQAAQNALGRLPEPGE